MNVQEEIRKLAYDLYEKSGRLGGKELENWLRAEELVMAKLAVRGKVESAELRPERPQKTATAGEDTKPRKTQPATREKVAAVQETEKRKKTAAASGDTAGTRGTVKKKSGTKSGGKTKKEKG